MRSAAADVPDGVRFRRTLEGVAVSLDVLMAAISPAVNDAWRSHPSRGWGVREEGDEQRCIAWLQDSTGHRTRMEPEEAGPESVAAMAVLVQELMARELPGEVWPPCPHHARHALRPTVADDNAVWACPANPEPVVIIGALVDGATAAARQADIEARAVGWIADYHGLTRQQAVQRARREGRPVRVLEPDSLQRANGVPSRLNLHLGPDGRLVRVSAG
jgi:hypothetical protein